MGTLTLSEETTAPGTPASNKIVVYPKSDGLLYWKDDAGQEYGGIATQAQQETGTAFSFVTSARQQYHPSGVKAWCKANSAGAIAGSYNVTSVTDTATGVIVFNLTVAFSLVSSMNGVAMIMSASNTLYAQTVLNEWASTSALRVDSVDAGTLTQVDPAFYCMVATGDQ